MKISFSPWVELEARHIAMSSELPPIPASLNEAGVGSRHGHFFSGFSWGSYHRPSGKLLHNCRKPAFLMGKSTISMAISNSKLLVYQGVN